MNVNDLFGERFNAYFQDAHADDPLWLFVHVPKTAGSSLNGELAPILGPSHHIFIDYSKLEPEQAQLSYEQLFDESVDRFIELTKSRRYRYCTGHINALQVQRILDNVPNVRPVTLLRDPVARFVSDFRYQRSAMHPGHAEFAAAHPTIGSYLGLQSDWNKMATSLLPETLREHGDPDACAAWLTRTYAFIGLQELYDLSLHALSWCAGVPRWPTMRKRINTPTPDTAVHLTAALESEIRARNGIDIGLYAAVAPRFTGIAGPLQAYLNRVAPRPPRNK